MRPHPAGVPRDPLGIFLPAAGIALLVMITHLLMMSSGVHAAGVMPATIAVAIEAVAHPSEDPHGVPEAPRDDAACDVVTQVAPVKSSGEAGDVDTPRPATQWAVGPQPLLVTTGSGNERADSRVLQRAFLQIYRV